jgi:hypothetical protein
MGDRPSEHDPRSEYDRSTGPSGSADPKAWQSIYRGDSGAGLANPNDNGGDDDEDDR